MSVKQTLQKNIGLAVLAVKGGVDIKEIITANNNDLIKSIIDDVEGMKKEEYYSCAMPNCANYIAGDCPHTKKIFDDNKILSQVQSMLKELLKDK